MRQQITSGQISNGARYEVTGTGTVTYASVVYNVGDFFTGVAITTFSVTGSPVVYEVSQLMSFGVTTVRRSFPLAQSTINSLGVSFISRVIVDKSSLFSLGVSFYSPNKFPYEPKSRLFSLGVSPVSPMSTTTRSAVRTRNTTTPSVLNLPICPIFVGQSNMQGASLDATGAPTPNASCKQYNPSTSTVVQLQEPSGYNFTPFLQGACLQSAFAVRYNSLSGQEIIQYKGALGGSNSTDWLTLIDSVIAQVNSAPFGTFPHEKVLVVYQGEADSSVPVFVYNWRMIIAKWRAVYGPTAKVFFIKLGNGAPGYPVINPAIQGIVDTVPYVYLGDDPSDLGPAFYGDPIHFNQAGYNIIGTRLADAMYNVLKHSVNY